MGFFVGVLNVLSSDTVDLARGFELIIGCVATVCASLWNEYVSEINMLRFPLTC